MPSWIFWATLGLLTWAVVACFATLALGRVIQAQEAQPEPAAPDRASAWPGVRLVPDEEPEHQPEPAWASLTPKPGMSILVVDDDPNLRALVRTSFEVADMEVDEAADSAAAAMKIFVRHPDVIVLDVGMPGVDGLTFCRGLKSDPRTRDIPVVLLTGDADAELAGWKAGADAFLRKPFSPLRLLQVVERVAGVNATGATPLVTRDHTQEQLLLYAQDFSQLLELERGQRRLLQSAYRETVVALAHALEAKDGGTRAHSERVRTYAMELAKAVDPELLQEPSLEYGFILHDVGKIGIPETVLRKTDALSPAEQRLLQTHPVLGEQMIGDAALLRGYGSQVVRSHHERWDGRGYPDGLVGEEIPLAARVFAIADTLDAMTSDRPYRKARTWPIAVEEIVRESGNQFDPDVVATFRDHEEMLRRIYYEVNTN
jgi:ribonuclease P protein subunit RPR2